MYRPPIKTLCLHWLLCFNDKTITYNNIILCIYVIQCSIVTTLKKRSSHMNAYKFC